MDDIYKKEMLAGIFLSKFSKDGLNRLGFKTYVSACKALANRVGGNWLSIRNYRDEFDPVFPNGRKGYQRPMMPSRKTMLNAVGHLSMEDMYELLIEQFFGTKEYIAKLDGVMKSASSGEDVARRVANIKLQNPEQYLPNDIKISSGIGKERISRTQTRINQSVFRKWVLANFEGKCCVTGLDVVNVLDASHISGWDSDIVNRMNPSNGLCLSSTYHRAFDAHLISFDENFRMVLSKSLRECCTSEIHKIYFLSHEGRSIRMPTRFMPDKRLMAEHCNLLVS